MDTKHQSVGNVIPILRMIIQRFLIDIHDEHFCTLSGLFFARADPTAPPSDLPKTTILVGSRPGLDHR